MLNEFYISAKAPDSCNLESAIKECQSSLKNTLSALDLDFSDICICRFFCSDINNQIPVIENVWPCEESCQRFYIGQQPLDSRYISIQAYCIKGVAEKNLLPDNTLLLRHGGYKSVWTLDYPDKKGSSEEQTNVILAACRSKLACRNMSFTDNVIRTWYYLRDIDNTYEGMIKSRVELYESWDLAPDTHFIASTGIEGRSPWPHALVGLQTHAVSGLKPEQIIYLDAPEYLSPTALYGVNFERATKIIYGDRCHCHISGTASIDKFGHVLYPGNVIKQAERALINIAALLHEGEMELSDMKAATVYLRDPCDCELVKPLVEAALPENCAINFTCGSVCRPDWLIEIEGEAAAMCKADFADFI